MRNLHQVFERAYFPLEWHKKRFPKATKKRRIMKKWLNRFGDREAIIRDMIYASNPLLVMLETPIDRVRAEEIIAEVESEDPWVLK